MFLFTLATLLLCSTVLAIPVALFVMGVRQFHWWTQRQLPSATADSTAGAAH